MKTDVCCFLMVIGLLLLSCNSSELDIEQPQSTTDAVILIVDDFISTSDGDVYSIKDRENCIVAPNGQRFGATGTNLMGLASGAHGDTVFKDLVSYGNFSEISLDNGLNPGWLKRMAEVDTANGKLIILGVDTDGYTTSIVAQNLEDAVMAVANGVSFFLNTGDAYSITPISNIIVNMSFAIVPCNTIDISLEAYQTLLSQEPSLAALNDDLEAIMSPEEVKAIVSIKNVYENIWNAPVFKDDPLYRFLQEREGELVYVASAGNLAEYGFMYPFAPAIWDFVISVSSEDPNNRVEPKMPCSRNGIMYYSNCGEIKDNGVSSFDSSKIGTSYAAPKFSYRISLAIMNNIFSSCTLENTALSVFGYAGENGDWRNSSYDDAIAEFCVP